MSEIQRDWHDRVENRMKTHDKFSIWGGTLWVDASDYDAMRNQAEGVIVMREATIEQVRDENDALATRLAAAEKELLEVKIQCGKNAMSHMGAYNLFRQPQAEATRMREACQQAYAYIGEYRHGKARAILFDALKLYAQPKGDE